MLYLFALLFFFFIQDISATKNVCNRNAPCGCSRHTIISRRIFGGGSAPPNVWTWTVSIREGNTHFCGGSILNERYVITAAHCFTKTRNMSSVTICAGTHRISDTCRQQREIKDIISHPSYSILTYENDIALIQVNIPFNFTDTRIARICLPDITHNNRYPKHGTEAVAVGWGKTKDNDAPDILQEVKLKIVGESMHECEDVLNNDHLQLCAGASGKDTCEGDSGGPLMIFTASKRWELTGITSYGMDESCATEKPGGYTRITAYLKWIQQLINNISPLPSNHRCYCECPRGSKSSTAYITVNTTVTCVDACKAVLPNLCNSSNTYSCLRTSCTHSTSTNDSFPDHSSNIRVFNFRNGDRYEGQFKDGRMHGKGTIKYANGDNYTGEWIEDKQTGCGIFTWPNGDRYEGQLVNGKKHGIGTMNYANNDSFSGNWIEDKKMTGCGVFDWGNGNRYEGEFKDGIMHGTGTYKFGSGNTYTGKWINGKRTGHGTFIWANRDRYEGDFHDNVRTGLGVFTWANGDRYQGEFKNDKVHGMGTTNFANGDTYTGSWIETRITGHGVFNWTNGDRYEGEFRDGTAHGTGTFYFANGNKYSGGWIDGKQSGRGVYILPSGDRYEGEFYNDIKTGRGKSTWSSGDHYEGQYEDGKMHGTGTMNYANGNNYTGNWVEDQATGQGVFTWSNGDRYEGDFKDGKKHGTGTIKFANGNKYTGRWVEDKRTGRGIFNWANGDRYEGEFKDDKMHGMGRVIFVTGNQKYGGWSNNIFIA